MTTEQLTWQAINSHLDAFNSARGRQRHSRRTVVRASRRIYSALYAALDEKERMYDPESPQPNLALEADPGQGIVVVINRDAADPENRK